jgi:hypothetical protein
MDCAENPAGCQERQVGTKYSKCASLIRKIKFYGRPQRKLKKDSKKLIASLRADLKFYITTGRDFLELFFSLYGKFLPSWQT